MNIKKLLLIGTIALLLTGCGNVKTSKEELLQESVSKTLELEEYSAVVDFRHAQDDTGLNGTIVIYANNLEQKYNISSNFNTNKGSYEYDLIKIKNNNYVINKEDIFELRNTPIINIGKALKSIHEVKAITVADKNSILDYYNALMNIDELNLKDVNVRIGINADEKIIYNLTINLEPTLTPLIDNTSIIGISQIDISMKKLERKITEVEPGEYDIIDFTTLIPDEILQLK